MTLGDLLDKTADIFPKKEAVIDDRVRLTYAELRERVDRIGCRFDQLGARKGRSRPVTASELELNMSAPILLCRESDASLSS